MINYSNLVQQLRDGEPGWSEPVRCSRVMHEAANAIEQLQAELAKVHTITVTEDRVWQPVYVEEWSATEHVDESARPGT